MVTAISWENHTEKIYTTRCRSKLPAMASSCPQRLALSHIVALSVRDSYAARLEHGDTKQQIFVHAQTKAAASGKPNRFAEILRTIIGTDFEVTHSMIGPPSPTATMGWSSPWPTLLRDAYTWGLGNFLCRPKLPECETSSLWFRRPRDGCPTRCGTPRLSVLR